MPHFIYINTPDASQATYFSHFVPLSVYGLMMKIIHILNYYWIIKVFKTECMGNKGVCLLVQNCPICHPNGSVNKKLYPISNCNPLINWNHSAVKSIDWSRTGTEELNTLCVALISSIPWRRVGMRSSLSSTTQIHTPRRLTWSFWIARIGNQSLLNGLGIQTGTNCVVLWSCF